MSQPPSSPALRERYDRRQQEVVTTAAALFARRGFQATSMDELSEATGLRSGGLYHYIGSKQNLLVQIFGQLMDPLLERAGEIEAGDEAAETQLRALVRAWLAHIETHLDHMAVFAQERHAIEHAPEWEQIRASRDAFEAILRRRLAAVGLTDRLALFALLGMVNHTATWLKPGGRLTAEQIADGYCDMLLD
jgi:TetR/AcrR family transcriptional regulator, cholesterol catabolism regulator